MAAERPDAKALKVAKTLKHADNWKHHARWHGDGYYELRTDDIGDVPVRLFLTKQLLDRRGRHTLSPDRQRHTLPRRAPRRHHTRHTLRLRRPRRLRPHHRPRHRRSRHGARGLRHRLLHGRHARADSRLAVRIRLANWPRAARKCSSIPSRPNIRSSSPKRRRKRRARDAQLVKVTLDNGRAICCTPDHEFMLRDGSYREAQDLMVGTSLMPFNAHTKKDEYASITSALGNEQSLLRQPSYNHKVVSVEQVERREDVYCLTVPEYGNFALAAGVFVHNCGMMSAQSKVAAGAATPERRMEFNRAVMERVNMGAGGKSVKLGALSKPEFNNLVRGGAEYYVEKYGATFDRSRAERHRIPVDDSWQIPWGGKGQTGARLESTGQSRRRQSLHRTATLGADGHALCAGAYGQSRLRARAGDQLFRVGTQRAARCDHGYRPRLFHARLGALPRLSERGRGRWQLRDSQSPDHLRAGRGSVSRDVRRGA